MKTILYVLLIFCLTTCKAQPLVLKNECIENDHFKKRFFYYLDNIEAYTLKQKNFEEEEVDLSLFKLSLEKISNYVEVNYPLLANYEFG